MNAVVDALSEYGIKHIDMPASPARVWQAIQDAKTKAVTIVTASQLHPPLEGEGRERSERAGVG